MTEKTYKHLTLLGTRTALVVSFANPEIFLADEIQGIGREFLWAADMAARIDMPLTVDFRNVEGISSALIGKLVLLNKKAKSIHVKLSMVNVTPELRKVFRRVLGNDGLGIQ